MKTTKVLTLFASTALLMSLVTACGGNNKPAASENNSAPSNEKVKLTMWHTFSDVETEVFEKKVIAKFNEEYPNIKIDATRMPAGDEFNQQLVQAVSGSSAPDLARMDIVDVPRYAKLGALEPLDGYEGFDAIKSEMFEGPMSSNFYDGKYYGLPLDTNTKIAIYNKKLLEKAGLTEAPKTFDELVAAAKKISNDETFGFAPQNIEVWGTMPYFFSLGGTYTNEDYTKATGYLNSDTSVKALEQLVSWNKEGLVGKSFEGGLGSWEGFKGDNYMMIDDGPWFASANQDVKDNMEFSLFPAGLAGSIETNGGENTVVFNSSKHKEAAYTFAKFLASDVAQTIFGEELRMMPVNTKTGQKDFVKNDEMLSLYMEQLKTAVSRVPSPEWTVINNVITKAFEAAIKTDETPKALLDDAAKQVDALLTK
ncbi:extracellular solute-binding protein [Paenibacillus segetis]|uniref:Sugar ABC transporter substrate-binding protein n=1 Tax=Paenibacillus segetis TaxID=1325360 RepID=A0ABQ1YAW2_9BACL|nr:extracellular solute-binding protein [Paenibacillus segetis]GGH19068.1 sugar ABC transporter substrate-binding protein [Paenibacillus segetis]